jgi:hypothetical protein
VLRGGCWPDRAAGCRAAHRYGEPPGNRGHYMGFRVAPRFRGMSSPEAHVRERRAEAEPAWRDITSGSENVRILSPISHRFVRSRSPRPDSAKTYENPVRGAACRNTDEFPVPVTAALIGRLIARPRKGLNERGNCAISKNIAKTTARRSCLNVTDVVAPRRRSCTASGCRFTRLVGLACDVCWPPPTDVGARDRERLWRPAASRAGEACPCP